MLWKQSNVWLMISLDACVSWVNEKARLGSTLILRFCVEVLDPPVAMSVTTCTRFLSFFPQGPFLVTLDIRNKL